MIGYHPIQMPIPLLEKNPDKIDWDKLSSNPNAIHLLEKTKIKLIGISYHQIHLSLKLIIEQ